jgi:hypothetical protein
MNIIGPDSLIFGVDDITAAGGRFEALDGTNIVIRHKSDPGLPPPMETASMMRKTVYGVADSVTLAAIASELRKDRDVRDLSDGSLETVDDMGFVLDTSVPAR